MDASIAVAERGSGVRRPLQIPGGDPLVRESYAPLLARLLKPRTSFHGPTQALAERVSLEHPATDVMTVLGRACAVARTRPLW